TRPPRPPPFPYTTLFRSADPAGARARRQGRLVSGLRLRQSADRAVRQRRPDRVARGLPHRPDHPLRRPAARGAPVSAAVRINAVLARALQPRRPLTVSQWCDEHMWLSSKGSSKPGRWVTDRNPPLREPMDNMSARSPVHDQVCMFPIQFGKSQIATNSIAYWMDYAPAPIMYALPGEASMNKWIAQKLNPMVEVCAAVRRALSSTASRDSANQRAFKDFAGGQLYVEHMGSPQRLKSTTVKHLVVDEIDEAPQQLATGDDPVKMLNGRTSSFPTTYKRLYISTPGIAGLSRIAKLYEQSDQRRYHVPCPHCGHFQYLQWSGLVWSPDVTHAWYACAECGAA